jgi:hypothetical protein
VSETGVIDGHPVRFLQLSDPDLQPVIITVCANCGEMRTILFLSRDRWLCTKCRVEGVSAPNLYPVS